MTDEATVFKLTFNKPAQRQFFDGPDVVGLRIKMDAAGVYFRGVNSVRGPDTVKLVERTRGGHEVTIEGSMAQDLLDALMSEATAARPFFILSRSNQKGWVECTYHNAEAAPQKFSPHMRVWAPQERVERPVVEDLDAELVAGLGVFSNKIYEAHRLVTEHVEDRKIGRPPRDVRVARAIMGAFELLASKVLANRGLSGLEMKPLRELRERLDDVMKANSTQGNNWHSIEAEHLTGLPAGIDAPPEEDDEPPSGTKRRAERKPKAEAPKPAAVRRAAPAGQGARARSAAEGDLALAEVETRQPDLPLAQPAVAHARRVARAAVESVETPLPEPVELPPPAEDVPPASPIPVSVHSAKPRHDVVAAGRAEPIRVRDNDAQLEPDFVQVSNFSGVRGVRRAAAQPPSRASQDTQDKLAAGSRRRA